MLLALAPCAASAGSQVYSAPGSYAFTVPAYGTLTVTVSGAGGGGGGSPYCPGRTMLPGSSGAAGGASSFAESVFGYGGGGGGGGAWNGSNGAAGSAAGGDTNTPGGGAAGGSGGVWGRYSGGRGGNGGLASKSYASGALTPGVSVQVAVGGGGAGGGGCSYGAAGAAGSVTITWTDAPAPSCSVTFDDDPLAYGATTTMRWSSSDAESFTIQSVGPVAASGAAQVGPLSTTDYTGIVSGPGGNASCPAELEVSAPPLPTADIYADDDTFYVGDSTQIHAAFIAGEGDDLVNTNIDSPIGTGLGASEGPDSEKHITFMPTEPGTYTFYARAATGYYPWATYGSVTIEVLASCTPQYACEGDTIRHTSAQCETSIIATCVTPSFCSPGAAQCLYSSMSFSASDDWSGHLEVRPSLVRAGDTVLVHWSVENAASCAVTGTNGDAWSGASAGITGKTSSPIFAQTVFVLQCEGHPDSSPSSVSESRTVNIIPIFQEL